jgi:hypothetical protein
MGTIFWCERTLWLAHSPDIAKSKLINGEKLICQIDLRYTFAVKKAPETRNVTARKRTVTEIAVSQETDSVNEFHNLSGSLQNQFQNVVVNVNEEVAGVNRSFQRR